MEEIKVNAVMLRATDYLENDKILTLFTAERGKITVGIKGVKKAGAKLKFAAQPFCFAEYILAVRSGRYTVINASENESFYDLRSDVMKLYAASASCEAVAALTEEGDNDSELFSFLIRTLSHMCNNDESEALVAFLLKALECSGYKVTVGDCAECGKSLIGEDKMRFSMDKGAFTCFDCGAGVGVSGSTYNALRKACNLSYDKELALGGVKRALKLLYAYTVNKTEAKLSSLEQYINLL